MREAETALQLRVGKLRAKGRWLRSGTMSWAGPQRASIAFRVIEYRREAEVVLGYQVNDRQVQQKISCETTYQRVGRRWWFLCPGCGRRMGVLYLPPGRMDFRCRDCYRIRYRSQEKDLDFILRPIMVATGVPRRIARRLLQEAGAASGTQN